MENTREIVLDSLLELEREAGFSNVLVRQVLQKYDYLPAREKAFIKRVTEGTLERRIELDHILNQFSGVPVPKMKPLIRQLMRMSVYQLFYMDSIPDSAVCNEAVKLTVKRRFQGLKGFVNGVLRTIAREKGNLVFPDDSVRWSMPRWLIDMWRKDYPEETVRKMLSAFLEKPGLSVRCNLSLKEKASIIKSLESQGVSVRESEYSDRILYLDAIDYLESLEAFRKGWIQVQDLSSSLVAPAASPMKGQYCIDVCAAPGGKSLHMADLLGKDGTIEARDLTPAKAALIEENVRRSGFGNVIVRVMDALTYDDESAEKADILLADLPCSGLGIAGRKPDIKYRVTPESIRELAGLQRRILSVVWQYVKPGGTLVYSTCTVSRQENEENAAWFVREYPFIPVNIEQHFHEKLRSETMKQGYVQLLPGDYPGDGFFLAVFKRI